MGLDALSEVEAAKYLYTCLWSSFTGGITPVDFFLCVESLPTVSPRPPRGRKQAVGELSLRICGKNEKTMKSPSFSAHNCVSGGFSDIF